MNRIEIDLEAAPEIHVEQVGRALHVKAWGRNQIRIDFADEADNYEHKNNSITISAESDCLLRVPVDSKLHIEDIGGDAHVSGIEGHLHCEQVGGSLALKRIANAEIEEVSGNLLAKNIKGKLIIREVEGNCSFKNVQGSIEAESISGNLEIKNCGPKLKAYVSGNVNISTAFSDDANYEIECDGNAYCSIEDASNLSAEFSSDAERILIMTEDSNQSISASEHTIKLGKGSAKLLLSAGGHIDFRTEVESGFPFGINFEFDDDFNVMVDEISDQVSVQMETQLESLSEQLESLGEQMQVSGNRAIKQAQKKVEAAQRRLEMKIKARGGKAVRRPGSPIKDGFSHRSGFGHSAEPVSEDERMKVLEMVQEKKISVEEAEMLLATLEGRSPKIKVNADKGKENNEK